MHGKGVLTYKDGRTYDGDFIADKREGNGYLTWANGNWYKGEFRQNAQHGKGVFFSKELGKEQQGEWENGKRLRWI